MKANELRVGNYVTSKTWKGFHTISGIEIAHNGFTLMVKGYDHFFDNEGKVWVDIVPIPLTPEILAKAGLKERYAKGEWSWAACKAEGQWDSYTEIVEKPDGYKYVGGNYPLIKYLHQLQNLYFTITGEELTIQL